MPSVHSSLPSEPSGPGRAAAGEVGGAAVDERLDALADVGVGECPPRGRVGRDAHRPGRGEQLLPAAADAAAAAAVGVVALEAERRRGRPASRRPRRRGASSRATRTSVKNTSLNDAPPLIWRIGRTSMPGRSIGMTNAVMPRCFGTSTSVRAISSPHSENWAPELHTFWPLTTHSSPSRTARQASGEVGAPARARRTAGSTARGGEEAGHELGPLGRACPTAGSSGRSAAS